MFDRYRTPVKLLAVIYVSLAVFYTTKTLIVSPLHDCISLLLNLRPSNPTSTFLNAPSSSYISSQTTKPQHHITSFLELKQSQNVPLTNVSSISPYKASSFQEYLHLNEDLFISKAFSNSLHPSKIIPFFYRATGEIDAEDITVTTLITSNRFAVFAKLVERYQGPISVTIHVPNIKTSISDLLDSLHALYTSSPKMSLYVDVHLVVDSFGRQFNTWRNIARLFARTEFVMMLDIDFSICTDFRGALRGNKAMLNKLREGNSAFVIPAFEYVRHEEGLDQATFPRNKQDLISLVKARRIDMFHTSWQPGHNSTDYPRYYSASPGEVYKVTMYQSAYEPYIIFKKEGPPWCEERFVGYGGNKAACLFEMYLSGISYYVLADHFIIHQNHLYDETARKPERKFNRKVYTDFKEETCLRLLKNYHELGVLNTTKGNNLQGECRKIKGFSRIATQLIST
ncbi:hypothetical protein K435DRAFT_926530 [Dendrothele bispora CBS 962.96]|uniref:Glycosyltransferase family 49 protein n=1 Tax=Dendrothele bispora (strain CBS 962.96) TaxID=1314807 RepID=A0A4S8L8K4_DENBC|nr:hypothetical protein K435DRAFT_926530 [Dendrothele bispora CBS 962.96]